jgi:hypothetical protein
MIIDQIREPKRDYLGKPSSHSLTLMKLEFK